MSDTDLLSSASTDAASHAGTAGDGTDGTSAGQAGAENGAATRRRGLSGMVLAELRELAGQLGITDTAGMRKGDLITAIKQRRGERTASDQPRLDAPAADQGASRGDGRGGGRMADQGGDRAAGRETTSAADPTSSVVSATTASAPTASAPAETAPADPAPAETAPAGSSEPATNQTDGRSDARSEGRAAAETEDGQRRTEDGRGQGRGGQRRRSANRSAGAATQASGEQADAQQGQQSQSQQGQQNGQGRDDDAEDGGGRRRGRRFRDRRRNRGERRPDSGGGEPEVREDDVLVPMAGILDVLDNYAFVRTTGYLSGPDDVYVSLSLVRKYGLRRGDHVTGAVRQPRDGEQQRQKFNPLVRVDTVNGDDVELAKKRPEFTKLTPLYPNERLRLETESHKLTTRIIDLVMPIGKGQRALIVSPPKAGKTMILQAIANAIATNNPECHLMVVLVDERPEEVTDMQRSVKGEVIASTFDRPPSDHTTVSELAIERAKRLVEGGQDVVVLLDSITRLGRAYNLAAPASGRILSGGVDSTALYPPKRFLGAARNIEGGGSLTIFATALVETGSTGDTVIFEEFKGTGNAELKLDRKISDRRVFPAVDVSVSSTRKEELLLSPDELAVTVKLRRVLSALDPQQAIDLMLDRLRKTRNNVEFLMQVAKTTPLTDDD